MNRLFLLLLLSIIIGDALSLHRRLVEDDDEPEDEDGGEQVEGTQTIDTELQLPGTSHLTEPSRFVGFGDNGLVQGQPGPNGIGRCSSVHRSFCMFRYDSANCYIQDGQTYCVGKELCSKKARRFCWCKHRAGCSEIEGRQMCVYY